MSIIPNINKNNPNSQYQNRYHGRNICKNNQWQSNNNSNVNQNHPNNSDNLNEIPLHTPSRKRFTTRPRRTGTESIVQGPQVAILSHPLSSDQDTPFPLTYCPEINITHFNNRYSVLIDTRASVSAISKKNL